MVHEDQNHEDFKVKGGGRQKLERVDGDVPLCMRKKEQNPEDDFRGSIKGKGGGRKELQFIDGFPKMHEEQSRSTNNRSKNEGERQQQQDQKGRQLQRRGDGRCSE